MPELMQSIDEAEAESNSLLMAKASNMTRITDLRLDDHLTMPGPGPVRTIDEDVVLLLVNTKRETTGRVILIEKQPNEATKVILDQLVGPNNKGWVMIRIKDRQVAVLTIGASARCFRRAKPSSPPPQLPQT